MKKIISLFFAVMLCFTLGITAFAATNEYTFTVETDGTATVGDEITVKLKLSKNGGGAFDLYAMQDYVCFDTRYFSYVKDSLTVYQGGDVFQASALDFNEDGTIDRVFVNRAKLESVTLQSGVEIMSFKLKVTAQGNTTLTQRIVEIFKDPAAPYGYSAEPANISIRAAGGSGTIPSGGGAGGAGGADALTIDVQPTTNGTLRFEPEKPKAGDTVTVVATPKTGYKLSRINVNTVDGTALILTDKGNGNYTFIMPETSISVQAVFTPILTECPFVDVKQDDYYYDAVMWAVENQITSGMTETEFVPNADCTRAQAVTFLWRSVGSPKPVSTQMKFVDVPADSFYYTAVQWAIENGITVGTGETTFSPDKTCDRGQIVTFLYRTMNSPNASTENPFIDVNDQAYYAPSVTWAVENNVTVGTSTSTFSPNDFCTRGQIVTFLYRTMVHD